MELVSKEKRKGATYFLSVGRGISLSQVKDPPEIATLAAEEQSSGNNTLNNGTKHQPLPK